MMKFPPSESVVDQERDERQHGTRIQSVSRACQVLLWLAGRRDGATVKEVAFANQLALPTTYHLVNTLADQGLVTKDARRRMWNFLGKSTAILAQAYLRSTAVSDGLLAGVRELARRERETAYLADWCECDIRVLASVEGTQLLRVAEVAAAQYEDAHAPGEWQGASRLCLARGPRDLPSPAPATEAHVRHDLGSARARRGTWSDPRARLRVRQ